MTTPTGRKHRIVVIGSGFGGLFGTQALKRRDDVEITLVARTAQHLFQPLLYQVATGILSEGEVAPSTREVLARQKNARVILGDVTRIDLEARTVTSEVLGVETVTEYDSLLVAAGSGQSYFGHDEFSDFAPGMKSVDDALELRARIFGAFELAELATTEEDARRALTFVVVGAGATGVEMAGQIAELARRTLKHDFRRIDPTQAHIILVDGADTVLPAFGERLGGAARARLQELGVDVRTSTMTTGVDETGVELTGPDGRKTRVEALTKMWAAGVQASPLGKQLADQSEAETDKAGRVKVNPDLTLPGHPEVFVVGDMIALDDLPGVAQVAIQGARYVAKTIEHRLDGKEPQGPFRYFDKGSMATVSRFSAVASIGRLRFHGFLAWLLWLGVHLVYIIGFKNRITTLLHWAVSFLGRGRAERAATEQQVFARLALKRDGEQIVEAAGESVRDAS